VWIVQEIVLAKSLILKYGSDIVDCELLTDTMRPLERLGLGLSPKSVDVLRNSLADRILMINKSEGSGFIDLIDDLKGAECKLVHNRVYGYLAIASDYQNDFEVDYRKSLDELYYDLMQFQHHHEQENLRQLPHKEQEDTYIEPAWFIRWTNVNPLLTFSGKGCLTRKEKTAMAFQIKSLNVRPMWRGSAI
jgi:hypothetical protein